MENYIITRGSKLGYEENVPINNDFTTFLINHINGQGGNKVLIDGVSGRSQTSEQLHSDAKRLAASLQKLDVLPGETIAVSCENRLEFAVVLLANIYAGTILVPVNPAYSPEEIIHVLGISRPCIVFCSASTYKNISVSIPQLKGIHHVILFDKIQTDLQTRVVNYELLLQNNPIERPHQPKDCEIAVILTSSGTTGLPKGVMLSYGNLKYFCSCFLNPTFSTIKKSDVILGLVPLYHGYGYGSILLCLLIGFKYVLLPKFEEKLFLSTIEKFKITNLCLVPPLMIFLAKHPLVSSYDLSSVREVVCGAAPLSSEVAVQVQTRLPGVDIRQAYGMTETTIVFTNSPPGSNKLKSVGKISPGVHAKIIDTETGKPLKRGEVGEIVVRGPCVMAGYCANPEATRQTIDQEGWLHTGDIGYVDDQGFFYIVDRLKELIKYKGFQVAPAELESLLLGLPGVRDAGVVGLPDPTAGELPIAYVVLQPNASLTDTAIMEYVNGKVSPQKRLRAVKFVDQIPRNPSGKILRRVLRNMLNCKL